MSETIPDAVPVSVDELARLRKDSEELQALKAHWVDNWESYEAYLSRVDFF